MHPRVAILIDGGFFLKRLPALGVALPSAPEEYAETVSQELDKLITKHLEKLNMYYALECHLSMLYRVFFYDAVPYAGNAHYPISKESLDFSKTEIAKSRSELFDKIKGKRKFALRLGQVARDGDWQLSRKATKNLIDGNAKFSDLEDNDFHYGLKQKGVDMRIGIDIATLALKKQVETIILVSGDSDFVPAAKLARREGVEFILDALGNHIKSDLFEHIDELHSNTPNKE